MARKIVIDCDLGIDDALALCLCLFDSRLDVLAVTACEGVVAADQANTNLQAIVGLLDPNKHPRLGFASPAENAPPVDSAFLFGDDGLGNAGFDVASLQHQTPSEKMIADCIKAHPNDVTILCLGPLTNIAREFRRDPSLEKKVDRLVIAGGSVNGVGNITAGAEFNMYFDPQSARDVFSSRTTKTLIPLDVSGRVDFGLNMLEQLPCATTRVGGFLRQIVPHVFRTFRKHYGKETIHFYDSICAMALCEPQLFEFHEYHGDVETNGEISRGVTIFDRRRPTEATPNMEVATSCNAEDVKQYLIDQLTVASNAS